MTMSMLPASNSGVMIAMDEPDPCAYMINISDTSTRIAVQFSFASEAYLQPAIFSIGILTNTISLVVLSGVRMNRVFRTCLVALALSDLMTTAVGLIQILVEVYTYCGDVPEGYNQPSVWANNTLYITFLCFVSVSASIVVFIAFIRNIMYLKPLRARAFFTTRITKMLCGSIVMLTVLLYTPLGLYIVWLSCHKETSNEYCRRVNESIPGLKSISTGYLYFVSAIYGPVMFIMYIVNLICIRISLNRSSAALAQMTSSGNDSQQQGRRNDTVTRITKTLTVILLLDVICTTPTLIQSIGALTEPEDTLEKKSLYFQIIDIISELFLAMRPTYNFWLYVFQRPEFRKRLKVLFHTIFYPCCKYDWCPYSDYFSKDKLKAQSVELTTSSGNGSKRNVNDVTLTSSVGAARTTPPATHTNKIVNNNATV